MENVHNKKVFKLQNRALRIISFSNFQANSDPLYAKLKILKLKDHIIVNNCLFVHDALNKVSPISFHEYFKQTKENHSFQTKNANFGCLYVTTSGTIRYGINSITNKCIRQWNLLSNWFKSDLLTFSRQNFQANLKLYFIQSYG